MSGTLNSTSSSEDSMTSVSEHGNLNQSDVHAMCNAFSKNLEIFEASNDWEHLLGQSPELRKCLGGLDPQVSSRFESWIQERVNKALNDWTLDMASVKFCTVEGRFCNGVKYKASINVTFADPAEAFDEDNG